MTTSRSVCCPCHVFSSSPKDAVVTRCSQLMQALRQWRVHPPGFCVTQDRANSRPRCKHVCIVVISVPTSLSSRWPPASRCFHDASQSTLGLSTLRALSIQVSPQSLLLTPPGTSLQLCCLASAPWHSYSRHDTGGHGILHGALASTGLLLYLTCSISRPTLLTKRYKNLRVH